MACADGVQGPAMERSFPYISLIRNQVQQQVVLLTCAPLWVCASHVRLPFMKPKNVLCKIRCGRGSCYVSKMFSLEVYWALHVAMTKKVNNRKFRPQRSSSTTDEDLCGRNVLPLTSLWHCYITCSIYLERKPQICHYKFSILCLMDLISLHLSLQNQRIWDVIPSCSLSPHHWQC